ncbi:unnamed protein product [Bursaphelenchus xylophilus]|uniref:Fucosyltransferase n=1 Tax=Bursaphelenchus xylophilus TaxID=6326 RepID=A0A1I7RQ19_BURXY|nr:unnamed protein product [Bursaphelenchus xylophilus]CAG9097004.1 unnamed protein product [Bursaphelenchus xylophilus]
MRGINFRWRTFFLAWGFVYAFFVVPFWLLPSRKEVDPKELLDHLNPRNATHPANGSSSPDFTYTLKYQGKDLKIKRLLTDRSMPSLQERLTPPVAGSPKKFILSMSAFQAENLGGCPDFNCEVTLTFKQGIKYDALINFNERAIDNFTGYYLFSTQESPPNSDIFKELEYNMSIGYRHDSPASSPYGYAVELAEKKDLKEVVDMEIIKKKKKGGYWLVSHCSTDSKRELLVAELQKYINVDILGSCGKPCEKGGKCEDSSEYHFYMALENSLCKEYITEKLWKTGFQGNAIPIVLKRSIVEEFVPPKSVIAFDDYKSVEEMARHLKELMDDKEKYLEYFKWRENYAIIFLDGAHHDVLERPWGICQLCRLLHLDPRPQYRIPNLDEHWSRSCESGEEFVKKLING